MMASNAVAQISDGTINGRVSDESAAVIPGVTITAKNLSTGLVRTAVTSDAGRYQIPGLPPGRYSVSAELQGFATVVHSEVTVAIASTIDVDVVMKLASVQETVTVTGEAPLVQSTKTDLSNTVT